MIIPRDPMITLWDSIINLRDLRKTDGFNDKPQGFNDNPAGFNDKPKGINDKRKRFNDNPKGL